MFLVRMLANGYEAQNETVRIAARLHIAFAGEIETIEEWKKHLRECCFPQSKRAPTHDAETHQWYIINIRNASEDAIWTKRLEAALLADATDVQIPGDWLERTGLDLLNHLTHDGNRLVRWAAQTRLANPDFVFTWDET